MTELSVERVAEIQESLHKAQERKSRTEGALEQLETRMREDYKCNSVEELEAKRSQLDTQLARLDKRFERLLAELEDVTEWDEIS